MRLLPLVLVALVLAGCSATQSPAPVREAGSRATRSQAEAPPGHYRVRAGDTLYKIAFQHGVDVAALAAWNRIEDPHRLLAGQLLRVTPPPVASGGPNAEAKAAPASVRRPEPDEAPPDLWTWPARGPLLARYGEAGGKGLGIAGERGQIVRAAASGHVAYAGSGLRGYGKLIIIRHGKTLLSAYAHNARILVAEGQPVARGQAIAEMGDSDADRIKLYFEIREYGKPVDPLDYLPKLS
ncbi:MAG: lipoprotein NlpD [bacterium]|nr:MAG: lipoprotein NlpD [bacterium]KAF0147943.1 MAG: lipoprotein NlpD [bacterium]KAF0168125.1 MAG: lipoprotein NlpD [bacterium]TXT22584.1 MAG: lipoprotein NlpD [bacterium]